MWGFHNPVEVTFGVDALQRIGDCVGGRKYLLVTYPEPHFEALAERVAGLAGPPTAVVDSITPNPDFADLAEPCNQIAAAPRSEVIVALGGGSVIDAAKVLAAAEGDLDRVRARLERRDGGTDAARMPIIAVPTTAGTGSEVTSWATLWDHAAGKKYSLAGPDLYPQHALVDPALMLGMPRALTIATGLDALSHALESLWNRNANPLSATLAVSAARLLLTGLPEAAERPRDVELRSSIARAALMAGLAFSNTKTALAHSLSYAITLRHSVPHGIACSFSLPLVMRSVIGKSPACDSALAEIFGPDLEAGVEQLSAFLARLGVPQEPSAYGVKGAEWQELIDLAFDGERGRNFIGSRADFAGAEALAPRGAT